MMKLVRMTKNRSHRRAQRAERYRQFLNGKTLLVTGASRGVGAAVARIAGHAGARVLLVSRNEEALGEVAATIEAAGGQAFVYPANLSVMDQVDALVEAVLADHGGVDILVHNAARSIRRPTARAIDRFHDYERTMALNYFAPVRLTLGLLPSLIERRGTVSLVLTMGVLARVPNFGAYLASKCALDAFGDVLACENNHQLTVSSVYLPLVRTEMATATPEFADRSDAMSAHTAGRMVLDGIVEGRRRVVTAQGRFYQIAGQLMPATATHCLNVLSRTYPVGDEPVEFPTHRAFFDRLGAGTPF
jgi:NAD(P)-dependent dehydrogenase (short-subunit alcohol dehydrogenase family)